MTALQKGQINNEERIPFPFNDTLRHACHADILQPAGICRL
jgi:hypothetical protein